MVSWIWMAISEGWKMMQLPRFYRRLKLVLKWEKSVESLVCCEIDAKSRTYHDCIDQTMIETNSVLPGGSVGLKTCIADDLKWVLLNLLLHLAYTCQRVKKKERKKGHTLRGELTIHSGTRLTMRSGWEGMAELAEGCDIRSWVCLLRNCTICAWWTKRTITPQLLLTCWVR